MLNNAKALILVLFVASLVFWVGRRAWVVLMPEPDFVRRRNTWLALTLAAFLSPSVWLYIVIAVPLMLWAGRKDSNPPAAFAALMFVAPNFAVQIPKIFAVTPWLLLCLCIALPPLLIRKHDPSASRFQTGPALGLPVLLLVAFIGLTTVPYLQIFSVTEVMRKVLVECVSTLVPFLFLSLHLKDRDAIRDFMASFVMACSILALVGVVESARSWLLYAGVSRAWGVDTNPFGFLMRDGQLRAMASTGHSLGLGITLAIGFAFCLFLRRLPGVSRALTVACAVMWAGLLAAFSRGPWIAALLMMMTYLWLMPRGTARVFKVTLGILVIGLMLSPTPLGQRILNAIPFVGSTDSANVEYRQKLLEVSLELIPLNPWFGDLNVGEKMESLRQGQGIIDIVNGYLVIVLFFGLVPMIVWLMLVTFTSLSIYRGARRCRHDADLSAIGYVLIGVVVGLMFFAWVTGIMVTLYLTLAVGVAYAAIIRRELAERLRLRQHVSTDRRTTRSVMAHD